METGAIQRRFYFQTKNIRRILVKPKFAKLFLNAFEVVIDEDATLFEKLVKFGNFEIKSTKGKEVFEEAFFKTIKLQPEKQSQAPKDSLLASNFKKVFSIIGNV